MDIREFIKKRPHLVWYTKNFNNLADKTIVEAVLNYGDFEDVKKLIRAVGVRKVAAIFRKQGGQRRNNYSPKVRNYFRLYFRKKLSRNSAS